MKKCTVLSEKMHARTILYQIYNFIKLTYLNNEEHTHLDVRHCTTDILDMAFITPCLKSWDIRFNINESLGGDHFSIGIFTYRPLQRDIPITSSRCQFAKADIVFSTRYQPISLRITIMKFFEPIIEKRFRKHFEDIDFLSKYQSDFREAKSTNYHLFHMSQTAMESFNRSELVIAFFSLTWKKP